MSELTYIRPGVLERTALGIKARLAEVMPESTFTYSWVQAAMSDKAWQRFVKKMPGIGIHWADFLHTGTVKELSGDSRWIIYLALKNLRGDADLMMGDTVSQGLLSMIQVAGAVLHGHTIPDLCTLQVQQMMPIFVEENNDPTLGLASIILSSKADIALDDVLAGDALKAGTLNLDIEWVFDGATVTDTINAGTS